MSLNQLGILTSSGVILKVPSPGCARDASALLFSPLRPTGLQELVVLGIALHAQREREDLGRQDTLTAYTLARFSGSSPGSNNQITGSKELPGSTNLK